MYLPNMSSNKGIISASEEETELRITMLATAFEVPYDIFVDEYGFFLVGPRLRGCVAPRSSVGSIYVYNFLRGLTF